MIVFGFILSPSQAATITGMYEAGHMIDPVPLIDGNYFLPPECVNNENYPVAVRQYLAAFPLSEVDYDDFFQGDV